MARVDLIVPTFNGTDYLLACLESLTRSSFTDFNLVVYDDGSTEPVQPHVVRMFPQATVMRNERNKGLTRAFNAAIDAGQAEYVVLLNNDTEVEPAWLGRLVACADRHLEAGSIASKLMLASDHRVIHSAGDTFSVLGMPGNRGVWLEDVGQYDNEEPVFSACAGAALYRRSALEQVRLQNGDIFDTRLFMYCEDVDLGWRLQSAGYPCWFAPDAVVFHHLSATGGGALASYYVSRNVWHVLARSVPAGVLSENRVRIAAYHGGRLFRAIRTARQPASRRSIAGSCSGLLYYAMNRSRRPAISSHELLRIRQLLTER